MKDPFIPIPEGEGFGFYGCPEHDEERDLVMCHQCGKWQKNVSTVHLRGTKCQQGINNPVSSALEYNAKYGYPSRLKHQAKSLRQARQAIAIDRLRSGMFSPPPSESQRKGSGRPEGPESIYRQNMKDRCDAQLSHALRERANELGYVPRRPDVDGALFNLVCRRYGSWNRGLRALGIVERSRYERYGDEELLTFLREFYGRYLRPATASDFKQGLVGPPGKPISKSPYQSHFGGLIKARLKAGLPPV